MDKVVTLPARFNMLHRGHEAYIKAVLRCRPRAVYVFLGRCNAFRVPTDPFDDVERRCMIASFMASLAPADAAIMHIFPIFNRKSGAIDWSPAEVAAWYDYCAALLRTSGLPPWDLVVSGSRYTRGYSGDIDFISPYDLVQRGEQVYVNNGIPLFATYVRQLLVAGDPTWTRYVSEDIARIIKASLDAFPMTTGPLEGVRHRVRVEGVGFDGQPFCASRVVRDGEFKDQVVCEVLSALLHRYGATSHVSISDFVPYAIAGWVECAQKRFDVRVELRSIAKTPHDDDLEYTFECNFDAVEIALNSSISGIV